MALNPSIWGPQIWTSFTPYAVDFDGDDETLSKEVPRSNVVFVRRTKARKKIKLGQLNIFTHLPDDVWLNIMKFQSDADKRKLSVVSKRFCDIYQCFQKMNPLIWRLNLENHEPWTRFGRNDNYFYYRLPKWTFRQLDHFYVGRLVVDVITESEIFETDFSLGSFELYPSSCTIKLKKSKNCDNYLSNYDHSLGVAYADGCIESDFKRYKPKGGKNTKVIKYHESVDKDENIKHNHKNKHPQYKQMKSKPNSFNRNYR
jgi:hypothetical protein